jgi:hypothetical protein
MIFWWFQRYNEMNSIQQLMAVSNCRAQRARDIILRSCKITTTFDVHVTVHRDKFLIIKPTRFTNFSNFIFGMKLYMFRTVPVSIIRSFSLYTQQWSMSANLYDIYHCCVQWKTPDDGQKKCPKHVKFHPKNKFEKLVHLVGFIIRNYYHIFW